MKIFFFVTTIASYLGISLACTCISSTQRSTWCSADWVSKVTVKSRTEDYMEIHYTVTQDEIFKGGNNLPTDMFSASSSAACGETTLQVGKSYLLAGYHDEYHTLTINYCTFMPLPLNDNYFRGPPEWTLVDNNLLTKLRNKNFLPCSPKNFSTTFQQLFDDFFDKLERSLNK